MALPDGAAQVFATRTRFSVLTTRGYVAAGSATFTTTAMMKLTLTPVLETGDTIAVKTGSGTLGTRFKHGDMAKYYTVTLEFVELPPTLEQMMIGGIVLTTSASAISAPGTVTPTPTTTGGSLKSTVTYQYKVTAVNQYGETAASTASTASKPASGTVGKITLAWAAVSGAKYYRIYGRSGGVYQFIAQINAPASGTPSYIDTGAIVPTGAIIPISTAGPGAYGLQSPAMGIVGNPNGVSIECWGKAVINGVQATTFPWWRWVLPAVKNLVPQQRDFTNAAFQNAFAGQAFENPNWGGGPIGDWQASSTRVWQRVRASAGTLPAIGLSTVAATT